MSEESEQGRRRTGKRRRPGQHTSTTPKSRQVIPIPKNFKQKACLQVILRFDKTAKKGKTQ